MIRLRGEAHRCTMSPRPWLAGADAGWVSGARSLPAVSLRGRFFVMRPEPLCGLLTPDLLPLSAGKHEHWGTQQASNQGILPVFSSPGAI